VTQAQLVALLRTPRGLAWLVLLTLVGAVGLALFMAMNLPFFEGTRKLVYGEPTGRTVLLAQQLQRGEVSAVPRHQAQALVQYYLADDPALGDRSWMPPVLAAVIPGALADEVERALLAGTPEQVEDALALCASASLQAARPALERARARAGRRGEDELAARIDGALAALATPRDTP